MSNNLLYNKYSSIEYINHSINDRLLDMINKIIEKDILNILIISKCQIDKTILINYILNKYNNNEKDILYINNIEEEGIYFFKNTVKTFCNTPIYNKKKIIVINEISQLDVYKQLILKSYLDIWNNNFVLLSTTTNYENVEADIITRTCNITLNHDDKVLYNYIRFICKNENIMIDSKSIKLLISVCNNSKTKLLNYLQFNSLYDIKISYGILKSKIILINDIEFETYTKLCLEKNIIKASRFINALSSRGYSVIDLYNMYINYIKTSELEELDEDKKFMIIKIINKYILIFHVIHERNYELYLLTNNIISIL